MSTKRSRATFEADAPPQHAPYVYFGTALPAYDPEARDDGSYVPIWKQEVTDERGRKRLHGAFTGGYSAGYFNTVGSKEGWTPSTFVSSRLNRAKGVNTPPKQLRPEDFMDEEDLAEQAESQKLETQGAFAGLGSATGDNGGKAMFSDLFRTTGETMGVKLLQRMGWRQGQGVGPKVKRRAKGDETGDTHLFAPENTHMISFVRKTDRKGLGFAGEGSLHGLYRRPAQDAKDEDDEHGNDARILSRSKILSKSATPKKTSFGVGVLNDTGSDDEDPYAIGPQIKYSRIIGGDKKKRKGGLVTSTSSNRPKASGLPSRPLAQRSATMAGFNKCCDGRLPLEGFLLTTKPLLATQDNQYPPPAIPQGWRSTRRATKFSDTAPSYQSTSEVAKASSLDPKTRAALLGEQQLPGKSIFDFLSPAARDKLAAASGKTDLPQGRGESAPDGLGSNVDSRTLWDLVPPLDKAAAAAALQRGIKGWMPYAEDDAKRERYQYFLRLRCGLESARPPRPDGTSLKEWGNELQEFAQAAQVFKPVSGLMAARFTSSTTSPQLASDAPDSTPAATKQPLDPAEEAAKMGMYGPLTRSRIAFYPTRLLCKRFNVRPPANLAPEGGGPGSGDSEGGKNDLVSQASMNNMMMHANFKLPSFASGGTEGGQPADPAHVRASSEAMAREEPVKVDADVNEALEGKRPDESVFKSVFED